MLMRFDCISIETHREANIGLQREAFETIQNQEEPNENNW